jgi:hypothetical protein
MKSLDIWNLSPSSQTLTVVICPVKGWDLKTLKGASDFGCLKGSRLSKGQ